MGIIGVPLDLGIGRRGVDMGPSAIRVAQLNQRLAELGYEVQDWGNVDVEQPEACPVGDPRAKYLPQIAHTCAQLADRLQLMLDRGLFPLVLGGDHSIAIGTVAALAAYLRRSGQQPGVVWIDAHADMNTPETTVTGNVHGMPLACCLGLGPPELVNLLGFAPKLDPRRVALVGLREVDQLERLRVRDSQVRVFTMRDVDERGMLAVMEEALQVATTATAGIHVSLDLDALDPREAPGVGSPVRGGLTYREAHLAMEMISDTGRLISMEVVEVNPVMDEANRTAALAVELILSAMGKRIL